MTPNIRTETINNVFKTIGDVKAVYFKYGTRANEKAAFVYISVSPNMIVDFTNWMKTGTGLDVYPYGDSNPYIVWKVDEARKIPIPLDKFEPKYSAISQLEKRVTALERKFKRQFQQKPREP